MDTYETLQDALRELRRQDKARENAPLLQQERDGRRTERALALRHLRQRRDEFVRNDAWFRGLEMDRYRELLLDVGYPVSRETAKLAHGTFVRGGWTVRIEPADPAQPYDYWNIYLQDPFAPDSGDLFGDM